MGREYTAHCGQERQWCQTGVSGETWVWLVLKALLALKTRAQCNSNNHLTGGSARPRPVTPRHHRPHTLGGRAATGDLDITGARRRGNKSPHAGFRRAGVAFHTRGMKEG